MGILDYLKPFDGESSSFSPGNITQFGRKKALPSVRPDSRLGTPVKNSRKWQECVFNYYDSVGELHYAAQFYGKAMSRLEWHIEEWDEETRCWMPSDNEEANQILNRIQGYGGDARWIRHQYGLLMFLTGEGNLFVSKEFGREMWDFLSTEEIRRVDEGGTYERKFKGSLGQADSKSYSRVESGSVSDSTAWAERMFRPHPRFSREADSPVRAVLDILEEILLLDSAVRARARNRAQTAGILFVPSEASFSPKHNYGDENMEEDPFEADLTDALTAVSQNENDVKSMVPMVVRVKSDLIQYFQLMKFSEAHELYPEIRQRNEAIKRLAQGLDFPTEFLSGVFASGRFTAWFVDESIFKQHLEPMAEMMVNHFTTLVLRPMLRTKVSDDAANKYRIWFDPSGIIARPDLTRDARDAYSLMAISGEAYRKSIGFDEKAAPTDEEWGRRVGVAHNDSCMAVDGIPSQCGPEDVGGHPEDPNATKERNPGEQPPRKPRRGERERTDDEDTRDEPAAIQGIFSYIAEKSESTQEFRSSVISYLEETFEEAPSSIIDAIADSSVMEYELSGKTGNDTMCDVELLSAFVRRYGKRYL